MNTTPNFPNNVIQRIGGSTLTWEELDNNFKYPLMWSSAVTYSQGMWVICHFGYVELRMLIKLLLMVRLIGIE